MCVIEYNEGIKGVDLADQLASSHHSVRKSIKWYNKLFFCLLDVCLVKLVSCAQRTGWDWTISKFQTGVSEENIWVPITKSPYISDYM